MAGIYIHIPFCKKRCIYCDFFSGTSLSRKGDVLRAIRDELGARAAFLGREPVETIYFGGGTPSLCTPEELGGIIERVRELFDTTALQEITVEANPDDMTAPYLAGLRAAGVDRLSIGVQSFIDRDLQWMNRRHDAAASRQAVALAREAGFDNITIDLIYGLPLMSLPEWEENLRGAIVLAPEHISAYHLTVEERTVLGKRLRQGKEREIGEEQSRAEFETAHRMLTRAGYEHYEVSNFARPGRRALHNSNYWSGQAYLGVGPSAHSYDGKQRQWNVNSIPLYLERQPRGTQFEREILSGADRYNEYVMTSLRCDNGIALPQLEREFGVDRAEDFARRAAKFVAAGTLSINKQGIYVIPPLSYLISDDIISELFVLE